jgi:hypothetical protein
VLLGAQLTPVTEGKFPFTGFDTDGTSPGTFKEFLKQGAMGLGPPSTHMRNDLV